MIERLTGPTGWLGVGASAGHGVAWHGVARRREAGWGGVGEENHGTPGGAALPRSLSVRHNGAGWESNINKAPLTPHPHSPFSQFLVLLRQGRLPCAVCTCTCACTACLHARPVVALTACRVLAPQDPTAAQRSAAPGGGAEVLGVAGSRGKSASRWGRRYHYVTIILSHYMALRSF